MKVSSAGTGNWFNKKVWTVIFALVFILPLSAYCQVEQEEEDQTLGTERTSVETPVIPERNSSSGIWQNDRTTGTRDNAAGSNSNAAANAPARPGTPGAAARPNGSTADGRDPGGNPDVPFDPNMNLAFLIAGVVFAFVVFRKKLKPATVSSKR